MFTAALILALDVGAYLRLAIANTLTTLLFAVFVYDFYISYKVRYGKCLWEEPVKQKEVSNFLNKVAAEPVSSKPPGLKLELQGSVNEFKDIKESF